VWNEVEKSRQIHLSVFDEISPLAITLGRDDERNDMEKGGYLYINTTKKNTALYVGVTSDLHVRDWKHKTGYHNNSFTKKYNIDKLVYYEYYEDIEPAIIREKQIKRWRREKKIDLIKSVNPEFKDLSLFGDDHPAEKEQQ